VKKMTNLKTFQLTTEEINVLEDMLFCKNSEEWLIQNFKIRNSIWQKCLKQKDFERELRAKCEDCVYDNKLCGKFECPEALTPKNILGEK